MSVWIIVAVLGRPSANTRDFFNSIKFWTYDSNRISREGALDDDPANQPDYADRISDGYQVLNWYAFPKEE